MTMMNRKQFDKNLTTLLSFKGVEVSQIHNEMLFGLLKNDFTDGEFGEICVEICKTCDLYNKYPDPKLFYDMKKKPEETVLIEEGIFFMDETIPEYKPYLKGMTDDAIEKVWRWIMRAKQGELVPKSWIVERIKQFNPNYMPVETIEQPCEDVKKLISGAIKKM